MFLLTLFVGGSPPDDLEAAKAAVAVELALLSVKADVPPKVAPVAPAKPWMPP